MFIGYYILLYHMILCFVFYFVMLYDVIYIYYIYHMLLRCIIYIYIYIYKSLFSVYKFNVLVYCIRLLYYIMLYYVYIILYDILFCFYSICNFDIYIYIYTYAPIHASKKDRNVVHHYSSKISLFYQFLGCHIFLSCNDLFYAKRTAKVRPEVGALSLSSQELLFYEWALPPWHQEKQNPLQKKGM